MTFPYRTPPTQKPPRDREFVDAVICGEFREAEDLFLRFRRPDRAPPFPPFQRQRLTSFGVELLWRPTLLDRLLTWTGVEGLKGPWSVRIGGRFVAFGFDEEIKLDPDIAQADRDALHAIGLL